MARYFASTEDVPGSDSTTASSYQTTLDGPVFTPTANTDYVVLASARINRSATGGNINFRFGENDSGLIHAENIMQCKDTVNEAPVFGIGRFDYGASPPASDKAVLQWHGGGATCTCTEVRCAVIEAISGDEGAWNNGSSTTTSTTHQDALSLTFTPATAGTYLFLAYMEVQNTNASYRVKVRFRDNTGGTNYNDWQMHPLAATDWMPFMCMIQSGSLSGSQTWKLQYATTNASGTAKYRNPRIFAFRESNFTNIYYDDNARANTTTGSTTYVTASTDTQTPAATDHLLIATGALTANTNTKSPFLKFEAPAGTDWNESDQEPSATGFYTDKACWLTAAVKTLAASPQTWRTRTKISSATNNARVLDTAQAVIDAAEAATTRTVHIEGAVINAGKVVLAG